jgi:hypothetical protein
MRIGLALALVALAAPATAAPCEVELVRVPDAARPVIEEWVAAETSCTTRLEVRVIETDGGLYVVATDPAGRMRERLVPDAITAAVLIASWVADASVPSAPAPAPVPPPIAISEPTAVSTLVTPRPTVAPRPHTLALGVIMKEDTGAGIRVEMDLRRLVRWDSWRLGRNAGVMLGVAATGFWVDGVAAGLDVEGTEASALALATAHARRSRSEIRITAGLGACVSRVLASDRMDIILPTRFDAVAPCGEATATHTLWVAGFGLRLGALLSLHPDLERQGLVWERGAEWRGSVAVVRGW